MGTMNIDLMITYECPACKQIGEAPLSKVLDIQLDSSYIGSGDSVPVIVGMGILCTGCKVLTPIHHE